MPQLSLRTLGEIRLCDASGEPVSVQRKDLVVLAYLAMRSPRPVRREELVGLFWDERDQRHALQSLRQVLVRLRRVVGDDLVSDRDTVRLGRAEVWLDARAFAAEAAAGAPAAAVDRWGGDFLPGAEDAGGEAYRAWLDGERESLRGRLDSAFEQLVTSAEAAGDCASAATWAGRWAERFPLAEWAHARWVAALHRAGRTAEARTQHAAFGARVQRELGQESSTGFRTLVQRLESETRFASPVPSASPGSAALFTPDLVGRDAAWRELAHAWEAARNGSAVTLVVEGGEGLGKTFLCERFLQALEDARDPCLTLRAHGRPEHRDRACQTAHELLAPLGGAPGLGGAEDGALAAASRLVPAIRKRFPNLLASPGSELARPGAVAEVLAAVAHEIPVTLCCDDVAAADRPSAELILALARHQPAGTLLLLTACPEDAAAPGVLSELYQVPGVRRLKLPPLSPAEIETLLQSVIALPPEDRRALAARLHHETGGNPFFATEIVSAMVDEGQLAPDARGIWRAVPAHGVETLPLPSTVVDAVARRLGRLGGAAQRLAAAASTLVEPFGRSALLDRSGMAAAHFDAALEELVARRMLRPLTRTGVDALEFAQPLIRRVARERLGGVCGPQPPARGRTWSRRARVGTVAGVAAILVAAAAGTLAVRAGAAPGTPVLAIGRIVLADAADTVAAAGALGDMLATNLARVPRLRVISNARMYQNVALLGNRREAPAVWLEAAVGAGAEELLEGSLFQTGGRLRLDIRRVELRTGELQGGYTVTGANLFELADRATAEIAADLGLAGTTLHLADVTTSSLVAYRFYEEGLRSYARGDYRGAIRLFDAAFAEDSTFAMAAHYALRSRQAVNVPVPVATRDAVLRLADRTTDRERLLIRGTWAPVMATPTVAAIAETLSIRYPTEPYGHLLLGTARSWSGDFLGAIPHLRRVVTTDSLALLGTHANCGACEALYALVNAYNLADSLPAAERVARQWVRLQPASGRAWHQLATALEYQGKSEALDARRRAMTLTPGHPYDAVNVAMFHIRAGDFASADRLLGELARNAQPDVQHEALWFLTISLRNQGRLRAALATAARLEDATRQQAAGEPITSAGHRAQVLFEMGRAGEAESLFRALGTTPASADYIPATEARHRCWYLTHRAGALAALGDTATLALLADSIEWWGSRSTYGRDRRLHHHARALLFLARGQPTLAVQAFERAIYSRNIGYTRTNLELARLLIDLRRAREAVPLLQSALRGGLEANNLYVTRTELQYLLGRAWDAAGSADSAAAQYRRVLAAWQAADPQFTARRDSIRIRLVAMGALR